MKKLLCGLLAVLSLSFLLAGCNNQPIKEPPEVGFLVADQFSGYRLGIVKNLTDEKEVTDNIEDPEIVKFSSVGKALSSLRNDKIHGLVLPAPDAAAALEQYSDISKLYLTFVKREISAITLVDSDFGHGINAEVTTIRTNGTADKIAQTHSGKGSYVRPAEYDILEGRVLRVGISEKTGAPLFYKDKNGFYCGINVDTAYCFAQRIHADIVIAAYADDEALLKALEAREIDIAMSDFIYDEENPISTEYFYTHPYCDLSTHILIKGETPRAATEGLSALFE